LSGGVEGLRLFEVRLETLTPTIISAEVGYMGFVHKTVADRVPGMVLRGALLSEALRSGHLKRDHVDSLALSPDFALTPLLALGRRDERDVELKKLRPLRNSLVAHSLCFASKWPEERRIRSPGAHELVNKKLEDLIAHLFISLTEKVRKGSLSWASGEVRSTESMPTRRVDDEWWLVDTEGWRTAYVQVGLDRPRGSSAPGVLYAYELTKPGCIYVGLMAVIESSFLMSFLGEKLAGGKISLTVHIGRGVSRGFGKVRLTLTELKPGELKAGWLKSELKANERVVLEATSPIFILNEDLIPVPPWPGCELALDNGWYETLTRQSVSLRLKVVKVYSRRGVTTYRGWSIRTGKPKMPIRALPSGSLLVCDVVEGELRSPLAWLLPVLGLNPMASMGFNQLAPIERDPFGGD